MILPGAILKGPVPQSNYSNQSGPKIGTVTHVIVGSADSAISEFLRPGAQLSAHFVVSGPGDPYADGTIFQLLDTNLCAYAQAAGNRPPTAYIAIEFSGQPTTGMSAGQLESGARIHAWAAKLHGFPLALVDHGTPGVTTHCHLDGTADPAWGDHPCPGPVRLGQMPGVVARAVQIAGGVPVPAPGFRKVGRMNATDPTTGGEWIVDLDGHVETWGGAPFCGAINYPGPWGDWKSQGVVWGIRAAKDGDGRWGYDIIYRHNQPFSPPGGAPGQYFSPFHFDRPAGQ